MNSKTPVSALQESAVKFKLSEPKYEFEERNSNVDKFKCVCFCDRHRTEGVAGNKQEAKQFAAHRMNTLIQAQIQDELRETKKKNDEKIFSNNPSNVTTILVNKCNYNPIGMLHEYCAKHKYEKPIVFEMGYQDNYYVVQCKHQSLVTVGKGLDVKSAKQNAFHEMLVIINSNSNKHWCEDQYATAIENYNAELALEITNPFKQQIEAVEKKNVSSTNPFLDDKSISELFSDLKVSERTLEELELKLKNMNIKFYVKALTNDKPFVLIFKTTTKPAYDCIQIGNTYPEAFKKLLVTAINFFEK